MKPSRDGSRSRASQADRRKELANQIKRLLEEKGSTTLQRVQKAIFEEKIESEDINEALKHFLSYRHGFLVRPMLISVGCEAVHGETDFISDVATPLVLMSAGMDIHDDIIDDQRTQESRRTVLGLFGRDVALLAGDALLFKGLTEWQKLTEKLPPRTHTRLTNMLNKAFFEVGDGEALELGFKRRLDIQLDQYLAMVRKKAADIELLVCIGGVLGDGTEDQINALGRFGRSLGMLWVLSDDVSDVFDPAEMKRRLNQGYFPLPLIDVLKNQARGKLRSILVKRKISERETSTVMKVILDADGLKSTREVMNNIAVAASKEMAFVPVKERLKLLLQASLDFISQIQGKT